MESAKAEQPKQFAEAFEDICGEHARAYIRSYDLWGGASGEEAKAIRLKPFELYDKMVDLARKQVLITDQLNREKEIDEMIRIAKRKSNYMNRNVPFLESEFATRVLLNALSVTETKTQLTP